MAPQRRRPPRRPPRQPGSAPPRAPRSRPPLPDAARPGAARAARPARSGHPPRPARRAGRRRTPAAEGFERALLTVARREEAGRRESFAALLAGRGGVGDLPALGLLAARHGQERAL